MCYLIAKNKNGHGCYALKTAHGKALVELKRGLNKEAVPKRGAAGNNQSTECIRRICAVSFCEG